MKTAIGVKFYFGKTQVFVCVQKIGFYRAESIEYSPEGMRKALEEAQRRTERYHRARRRWNEIKHRQFTI